MKKIITGIVLFSFPLFASAELAITSEILIGQTKHDIKSYLKSAELETRYSSSLNDNSFGFRLGVKLLDYVSVELSKHDHGSVVNEFTINYPTQIAGTPDFPGGCCLGPEHDYSVEAIVPIELESIRLGMKGEMELFTNVFINARLGLAHWKYGEFTPQYLTNLSRSNNSGESGNDLYYSFGGEYSITENLYVGFEYSLLKINEKNEYSGDRRDSYKHDIKDLSLILGWEF